jgi:hypothetical protein
VYKYIYIREGTPPAPPWRQSCRGVLFMGGIVSKGKYLNDFKTIIR